MKASSFDIRRKAKLACAVLTVAIIMSALLPVALIYITFDRAVTAVISLVADDSNCPNNYEL